MLDLAAISKIGISHAGTIDETRSVVLTNKVGVVVFLLCTFLFAAYATLYSWNLITTAIPIVALSALLVLPLNHFGFLGIARFWLCILLPASCLFVSIVSKLMLPVIQDSEYYEFRFIMVVSAIIPCILFRLTEPRLIYSAIAFHFVALALYDPLHNLFGAGYYQQGQSDGSYYFTNVIVILTITLMVVSILWVKKESESSEAKNLLLIKDLEERSDRNEAQKEQILRQSHILEVNQQKLADAYQVIERQKELLSRENKHLENEMVSMNKELTQTNDELIRSNNELRQFSFTVSHNLRGPVASLLGLVNLLNMETIDEENRQVLAYILESANQLDDILNDLREITDIRHDVFNVRQKIDVKEELDQVMHFFKDRLDQYDIRVETELECEDIFSVRPLVHNILHNLISNGIKYRAAGRQSVITIRTSENTRYYILSVEDNGLGIDLERHRHDLFRLYKRFHSHNEGRGLGLYLIKLQAETLGGFVDIQSEVDRFTRFTVYLRKPVNLTRQILYNMDYALIFFDPRINCVGVTWRGPVTSIQYRDTILKTLDFLNTYNTPNWISDASLQGAVSTEDQEWMFSEVIPTAAQNGLKRIVGIVPLTKDGTVQQYLDGIRETAHSVGCELRFFSDFGEAGAWIQEENQRERDNAVNYGTTT